MGKKSRRKRFKHIKRRMHCSEVKPSSELEQVRQSLVTVYICVHLILRTIKFVQDGCPDSQSSPISVSLVARECSPITSVSDKAQECTAEVCL